MTHLSTQILAFLSQLHLPDSPGVVVLNPYHDPVAWELCSSFYKKYYSDDQQRTLILGINPGRFGGGVTGIPFTDPVKLEEQCGIPNNLNRKTELSADFIYQMITSFGGPDKFYKRFYISSVSPLGFTDGIKNLNYYDHRELERRISPFIIQSIKTQLGFGLNREICFCLGEGKNFKYLTELNQQHQFFKKIIPLSHPRFIMQYRRKKINQYIANYLAQLEIVKI